MSINVAVDAGTSEEAHSQGFRQPNYTQIPNELMDHWLSELSGAELKVLLYLLRRTFGFHRDRVEAGLRRICTGIPGKDRGTGLHIETASTAVKSLQSRGLLVCERKPGGRTLYNLRIADEVYGKSEHYRSENPNTQVYGKAEDEERKSSSEKKAQKKTTLRRFGSLRNDSIPRAHRGLQVAPELVSQKLDDDARGATQSASYASSEDELRDIYRTKAGAEMSRDLLNRIRETCELRGVPLADFIEELRPHIPNAWRNPAGFLTNFAQKIRSKMPGSGLMSVRSLGEFTVDEPRSCARCSGTGRQGEKHCDCGLGRDLACVERKLTRAAEAN